MWSADPYELKGVFEARGKPMRVDGLEAAAMRCLDEFDPLGPSEDNRLNDLQTSRELCFWLDGWRWCPELGCAVAPNGDMLRQCGEDELRRMCSAFLKARIVWADNERRKADAADDADGLKRAKAYLKFAEAQATATNLSRQVSGLKAGDMPRVAACDLDAESEVMGTPDGVLDLKTGALVDETAYWQERAGVEAVARCHDITKRTAARLDNPRTFTEFGYDDRWDEFVLQIMDGDEEKAAFLQRALGYSLLGGNPEKATFVLWGPNRNNGKSTLMNAVKRALGDYACSTDVGIVLEQRFRNAGAASPEVAKLAGKRLVDLPEPPAGARLDSSKVKLYASGADSVTARFLNRDSFEFIPTFTLWMHCNALPVVDDPSALNGGGMHVIEFSRSFADGERDMGLLDRFATETGMHTIIEWMLRGLTEYRRQGLNPPASVRGASQAWSANSGTWLDGFVRDECVLGSGLRVPVNDLKEAMRAYCEEHGEEMMTMRAVNRYLKQLNVMSRNSNNTRYYFGIDRAPRALPTGQKGAEAHPGTRTSGGGGFKLR